MINVLVVAFLLLLLGDCVGTFGYHVPEHAFGKYHSIVHHSPNRSFVHYAITRRQPSVLWGGFKSALPYLCWIPILGIVSPIGVILGLILAEMHVIWRHQFSPEYQTPIWLQTLCKICCITTPERHLLHHQDARLAYGDIFTFYDLPAQWWLVQLKKFNSGLASM
jgi:sterol desaturase/sphingolipid hydroxylase (fatty acid hydroxylase superfamily)